MPRASAIVDQFGERYLPEKARFYSTKAKNAQEAHEAIRPTDFNRTPDSVRKFLDADQIRLYDLIWKRGIAEPDGICRNRAHHGRNHRRQRSARRRVCAPSVPSSASTASSPPIPTRRKTASRATTATRMAACRRSMRARSLAKQKINATQHFTEPPPRYSEATLIKKMEELGIGRPSTYAATLATLRDRDYVTIDKRKLIPDAKGRIVTAFLESFFTNMSNTTSPPISKRSSTASPPAN